MLLLAGNFFLNVDNDVGLQMGRAQKAAGMAFQSHQNPACGALHGFDAALWKYCLPILDSLLHTNAEGRKHSCAYLKLLKPLQRRFGGTRAICGNLIRIPRARCPIITRLPLGKRNVILFLETIIVLRNAERILCCSE